METSRFHCHRSNANLFLNVAFVRNDPHATSTAGWRWIIFPCGMPACVTPRETSHSPKGSLVLLCTNVCCFFTFARLFQRPWVFSRTLGCEARRRPACTPRRKFGSRAGCVARALGVQSLEIWRVITGLLFAELEPSKAMANPHACQLSVLLYCCKIFLFCGSHGK